jgi:hypothetical protein
METVVLNVADEHRNKAVNLKWQGKTFVVYVDPRGDLDAKAIRTLLIRKKYLENLHEFPKLVINGQLRDTYPVADLARNVHENTIYLTLVDKKGNLIARAAAGVGAGTRPPTTILAPEPRVEPRFEPRVEPRVEPRIEPRVTRAPVIKLNEETTNSEGTTISVPVRLHSLSLGSTFLVHVPPKQALDAAFVTKLLLEKGYEQAAVFNPRFLPGELGGIHDSISYDQLCRLDSYMPILLDAVRCPECSLVNAKFDASHALKLNCDLCGAALSTGTASLGGAKRRRRTSARKSARRSARKSARRSARKSSRRSSRKSSRRSARKSSRRYAQ